MKDKERVRVPGALEGFDLTAADANDIIMKARLKAGWVTEEDLKPAEAEPEADAETATGGAAG